MSRFMKNPRTKMMFHTGMIMTLTISVIIEQIHWPVSFSGWFLGSVVLGLCFVDGLVHDCKIALNYQPPAAKTVPV